MNMSKIEIDETEFCQTRAYIDRLQKELNYLNTTCNLLQENLAFYKRENLRLEAEVEYLQGEITWEELNARNPIHKLKHKEEGN